MAGKTRNRRRANADQRVRLLAAMTQAAARHGYRDTSVARVVEQAGVSRATFYEHFDDKEACFLAAFEIAAERIERAMRRIEADFSPAFRAGELLDDLLVNTARDPASARILLVEALAGGPAVRRAHERFVGSIETTFERWLAGPGEHGFHLTVPGRAVSEGIGGILLIRCFRGETAALVDLRRDLLAWIYSYSVAEDQTRLDPGQWRRLGAGLVVEPPGASGEDEPERKLPRGRTAASPEAVRAAQRARVIAAVMELAQTKGYLATTVADIVATAPATREAFYELFRNKEEAFLAAQTAELERTIAVAGAGFFAGENWADRVWGGLEALFVYFARQPAAVYLDVIENYAAGEAALRRSFDNRMAYSLFFEDGYRQRPEAERLPRLCSEAIGNTIVGMIRWQVGEGRTERMLELLPQAAYVALAPFIGPAAALSLVEGKVRGRETA